ncbi:MAG: DUF4199 domain-containing protein [Cyclobacteriaceae bacterium]|nr:DUF4199 domain-containing protein [Cyclobacteriaceae bacterium]
MEEQNESVSVKQVAIKWGLISGILSIVVFLVVYFAGMMGNSWIGLVSAVITVVLMVLAHKEFKESGNGYMSYGQGLGLGTLMVTIGSVISALFSYIYIKFINTGYIQEVLDMSRAKMEDQGQSDAQIDAAMGYVEKFTTPEMTLIMGLVFGILFGFIIALIVSAITKKNDPALEL